MFFPASNITCFTFCIHLWPISWLSFVTTDSILSAVEDSNDYFRK
jgi:hypothetical protein